MKSEEVLHFLQEMARNGVQCELSPGVVMTVEEVKIQTDEDGRLRAEVVVGDEDWNDSFVLIFPVEGDKPASPTPKKPGKRGK